MSKHKNNDKLKLDLHGVKHEKIHDKLEDFCFINTPPFKIITGNSYQMKNFVIKFLNKYNYKYMVGDIYNQGYITVL
jgi:hypothetical protein